ncbi:phage tail tape measure protein [Gammaproteobacteria bacterium]|nr:phage tail tape measure protein [Gammaproteobacteria bacterium]
MKETASLVLKVDSRGVSKASGALGGFTGAAGRAEGANGKLGKSLLKGTAVFLGIGTAILAARKGFDLFVNTAKQFEQSLAEVKAVTQATSAEMVGMEKAARKLGATTRFSASEAAEGMRFLGMAGFETSEIITAMPGLLDLAAASGLDLGTAADITSNIMSGFNLVASESSRVADLLAGAASSANTNVQQLGEGMKFVAPLASAFNIEIEDVTAAMGVMSDAGLQASLAGTGLRIALAKMADVTPDAEKALKKYGLTAEDVDPSTNNLVDTITRLSEAGLTATDALEIFDIRGAPAILALTSQSGRLNELAESFRNIDGRAKEMAETMADTLTGDLLIAKSALQELALVINDKSGLTDSLRDATQAATELFRTLADGGEATTLTGLVEQFREAERIAGRIVIGGKGEQAKLAGLAGKLSDVVDTTSTEEATKQISELNRRIAESRELIKTPRKPELLDRFRNKSPLETEKANLEELLAVRRDSVALLGEIFNRAAEDELATTQAAAEKKLETERQANVNAAIERKTANDETIAATENILSTQEEKIAASYQRQIDLVKKNVTDTIAQESLIKELREKRDSDLASLSESSEETRAQEKADRELQREQDKADRLIEQQENQLEQLRVSLLTEEEAIQESYENRMKIIAQSSEDTGDLLVRIEEKKNKDLRDLQTEQWNNATSAFGNLQDNLLILARTGNSKIGKVYKAAAIAQAIIATIKSVQNALADVPWPFNYPAAAVAAAAGAANISAIRNQPVGNYADGGILGGNSPTGDKLNFNGNSGEVVLNFAQQKELMSLANGKKQGGKGITVNINTLPGETADVRQDESGNMDITIRRITQGIAKQLFEGQGDVDRGLGVALRRRGLASA